MLNNNLSSNKFAFLCICLNVFFDEKLGGSFHYKYHVSFFILCLCLRVLKGNRERLDPMESGDSRYFMSCEEFVCLSGVFIPLCN